VTAALEEAPALILPEPVGLQYAVLDSPAARKLLRWGRRSGKTRVDFLAAVHGHGPGWEEGEPQFPGILQGKDVVWVAQNYRQLGTVLWKEEIVPRFGHLPFASLNSGDHDVKLHGLGTLMLRSGERDAILSIKGIGAKLGGVIIDEAAWLALRWALTTVILPALIDNDGWLIVSSTTNAGTDGDQDDDGRPMIPSYFNRLCQEHQQGKRPGWEQFSGTAHENPTLNPAAIDELIDEYTPGSTALRQEIFVELLEPGAGLALPHLSEARHLIPPFEPDMREWSMFAALDWGYHHPWVLTIDLIDADGQIVCKDTLTGRLDLPGDINTKVRAAGYDPSAMIVHAGGDIWRARRNEHSKSGGNGPTVSEVLMLAGWKLTPANDARVAGLNNFRLYTHVPDQAPASFRPRFVWMNTPTNRVALAQCRAMTLDPKNPEDALKIDADSSGRGGDDFYDCRRYGLMSRPIPAHVKLQRADEEGVSMGYDYNQKRVRERETGDQILSRLIGTPPSATAGRYRVPVRRG
jgi:hypothetical protein